MTTPEPLSDGEIKRRFLNKIAPLAEGQTLDIKLSRLTFREASRIARAVASKRRWLLTVRQTPDGILLERAHGVRRREASGRWGFGDLEVGESRDYELAPADFPSIRNAASQYAQRTGRAFSVNRLGLTCTMRVTRLADDARSGPYKPDPAGRVERGPGEWPFNTLKVGQWFFVPITEKRTSSMITPLCSYHGKRLGCRFSVRSNGTDLPPLDRGHYVVRME